MRLLPGAAYRDQTIEPCQKTKAKGQLRGDEFHERAGPAYPGADAGRYAGHLGKRTLRQPKTLSWPMSWPVKGADRPGCYGGCWKRLCYPLRRGNCFLAEKSRTAPATGISTHTAFTSGHDGGGLFLARSLN